MNPTLNNMLGSGHPQAGQNQPINVNTSMAGQVYQTSHASNPMTGHGGPDPMNNMQQMDMNISSASSNEAMNTNSMINPMMVQGLGHQNPVNVGQQLGHQGNHFAGGPIKDNTALLCKFGQETVQEIVTKTTEIFSFLKLIQPPNGTSNSISQQEERKAKMQDFLRIVGMQFKKLRKLYERVNESCAVMDYIQMETLIPLKEENENSSKQSVQEEKKVYNQEYRECVEQLRLRNKHLKEVIDSLRNIVWEINTMLAMRKP